MRQARRRWSAPILARRRVCGRRCGGCVGAACRGEGRRRTGDRRLPVQPARQRQGPQGQRAARRSPIPTPTRPASCIKLGAKVDGGVGPDGDIVGFTTICPHKGFPLGYNAGDKTLNCPGHYSRFDVERGGLEIWGQATQNLPQYTLRVDDKGDIYAEGLDELLYGRLSNVL